MTLPSCHTIKPRHRHNTGPNRTLRRNQDSISASNCSQVRQQQEPPRAVSTKTHNTATCALRQACASKACSGPSIQRHTANSTLCACRRGHTIIVQVRRCSCMGEASPRPPCSHTQPHVFRATTPEALCQLRCCGCHMVVSRYVAACCVCSHACVYTSVLHTV